MAEIARNNVESDHQLPDRGIITPFWIARLGAAVGLAGLIAISSGCPMAPTAGMATESNPAEMKLLETESFLAFIADNSRIGMHADGYNGVASLIPRTRGNNVFVPTASGMNFEAIGLAGSGDDGPVFEPRTYPMRIVSNNANTVVLEQEETEFSHVSSRITFRVEEPHYLHQRIELVFHRRFVPSDTDQAFSSLWASYIHRPADRHLYFKADPGTAPLADWIGLTSAHHGATNFNIKPLPDQPLSAAGHLESMHSRLSMTERELERTGWPTKRCPINPEAPLNFYYGFAHYDTMLLFMFRQPEFFRLAYSPNGGGSGPVPSPAWDYEIEIDAVEIGRPYVFDLCLVAKAFAGRDDVLAEVARYRALDLPAAQP